MHRALQVVAAGAAHSFLTLFVHAYAFWSGLAPLARGGDPSAWERAASSAASAAALVLGLPVLTALGALGVYAPSMAVYYALVLLNTASWAGAGLLVLRWRARRTLPKPAR